MPSWDKVESDIERGPGGLFKWIAIAVIAAVVLFGGISLVTKPAGVAVDRIIMKNSFQYREGMAQRGAILESQLVEINMQISQATDSTTVDGLQKQKVYIRSQIRAITINE